MTDEPFEVRWRGPAVRQLEVASSWWGEHRPSAPTMLRDEIESAAALLQHNPHVGVTTSRVDVRRILLRETGYFLYYRVRPRARRVEVLAVWSASRGSGPPLPR